MNCRHCRRRPANRARRLCAHCYFQRTIRDLYPVTSSYAPKREPTEAEMEAMIREQGAKLPAWWNRELGKE